MKCVLVFVATFVLLGDLCGALDEEFVQKVMKKMQEIGEKCQKETGASEDDISILLERKIPDSHEGKCMISCFGTHLGMKDAQGQYSEEGTKAALQPLKEADEDLYNKMLRISTDCVTELTTKKTDDECQNAAYFLECSLKREKELGLENGMF